MRERQEKAERRDILLSSLPATSTPVPSLADLKTHCGQNHYSLALLSMLEAALAPPQLTPAQRTNLLNEALSSLQQLDNEQGLPRSLPLPVSSPSPPPPLLLHQTPTSLTFMPAPWNPPHNQQVCFFALRGLIICGVKLMWRFLRVNINCEMEHFVLSKVPTLPCVQALRVCVCVVCRWPTTDCMGEWQRGAT